MSLSFRPGEDEVGKRIDVVVARRAGVPRTRAQRALRGGSITVAGRAVPPSHRLEAADLVEGDVPPPTLGPPEAEDIALEIRYSDNRLLVVSKPAGLVTHPATGHETGTLVNALLGLGVPLARLESGRPGIVHRLDKDTSGLLLVAKDDDAHAFLVEALQRREIERRYLALVRGRPNSASGTVDAPVGRHPGRPWLMAVTPGGRPAVTHFRIVSPADRCTLLEVRLETGRTHQVRVHLAHLGHPVLGDGPYGGASELSRKLGLGRPFLHARSLAFPHPDDGRRLEVDDDLPGDLAAAAGAAGIDPAGGPG